MTDFDDSRVTLCDGAISVEGVMVSASRSFVRDPRIAQPTDAMIARLFWRDVLTARIRLIPDGYKYCSSGLRHAAPFEDAVLPVTEFGVDTRNADGRNRMCKHCRNYLDRMRYSSGRDVREYRERRTA